MAPSAITTIDNQSSSSINTILDKDIYLDHHGGYTTPKQIIGEALKKRVESIDPEDCEAGDEDTFFVADLGEVYRQHMRWKLNLPRVKPFYGEYWNLFVSKTNVDVY